MPASARQEPIYVSMVYMCLQTETNSIMDLFPCFVLEAIGRILIPGLLWNPLLNFICCQGFSACRQKINVPNYLASPTHPATVLPISPQTNTNRHSSRRVCRDPGPAVAAHLYLRWKLGNAGQSVHSPS